MLWAGVPMAVAKKPPAKKPPQRKKSGPPKGVPKARQKAWRAKFLRGLVKSASVAYACKMANVCRATAYEQRQNDPEFAEAWDEALVHATELLEAEAQKRAMSYSDVLMIFLLKSRNPAKYSDRQRFELTGPNGGPISISTPKERAKALAALIAKAKAEADGDDGPVS
jgi:hypothetical protein